MHFGDGVCKSQLDGFFDCNPGGDKTLYVRYLFQGRMHEVFLDETEEGALASPDHLVRADGARACVGCCADVARTCVGCCADGVCACVGCAGGMGAWTQTPQMFLVAGEGAPAKLVDPGCSASPCPLHLSLRVSSIFRLFVCGAVALSSLFGPRVMTGCRRRRRYHPHPRFPRVRGSTAAG